MGRASILCRGSDFVPHTWGVRGRACAVALTVRLYDLENDCKRVGKNEVSVHSKKAHTNPR